MIQKSSGYKWIDDTSTGSHFRFIHFLPCLLVKIHDNDDGKNMHETNVAAIGMHCLFTRFYCKRMFPTIGFHLPNWLAFSRRTLSSLPTS